MSILEYASTDGAPVRRSAAALLWRRLSRNGMSLAAFAVIAVVALGAAAAPAIMPYDPDAPDAEHALEAPSLRHWLGTDLYGRDQLTRIVYAGRIDLLVALAATAIALSVGAVLGAVSGYRGGWIDQLLMRVIDTIQAFPSFILAMGIAAALGNTVTNIVVAIAITHVPIYGRLIRGEMLRIREMEYAEAARTVGNRQRRIIFHHLLPNCFPPVIVQATLAMGFAILTVAALSYIGLGIRPPTSEWGAMTAEGAGYIVSGEWWIFVFPGVAIMAVVLSFNLIGDALRDVLDPRMKGV
ncbi:MAG: ABC transporter permease [Candidatus Rokuibacteriota bacterium]